MEFTVQKHNTFSHVDTNEMHQEKFTQILHLNHHFSSEGAYQDKDLDEYGYFYLIDTNGIENSTIKYEYGYRIPVEYTGLEGREEATSTIQRFFSEDYISLDSLNCQLENSSTLWGNIDMFNSIETYSFRFKNIDYTISDTGLNISLTTNHISNNLNQFEYYYYSLDDSHHGCTKIEMDSARITNIPENAYFNIMNRPKIGCQN